MRYTKRRKAELVEAFTAAKKYLWNGKGKKKRQGGLSNVYICHVLQFAVRSGELESYKTAIAKDLIEHRLGRHCSVNDYLYDNRYTQSRESTPETQAYRLA
jgi:hypothetical protein